MNAHIQPQHISVIDPADMVDRLYGQWSPEAIEKYKAKVLKDNSKPFVQFCNNVCLGAVYLVALLSWCTVVLVRAAIQKVLLNTRWKLTKQEGLGNVWDRISDHIVSRWIYSHVWRENRLFLDTMQYSHDMRMLEIPAFAQDIVEQVRALVPDARFTVTYCSSDPILHCLMGSEFYPQRCALCVWDFDTEGAPYIVPPPL